MVLFAKLLSAQQKQNVHLVGQIPRLSETLPEQRYFGDQLAVWHHHGYGAKHRLQIVGQFCSAGVTGIHRYEYAARGFQVDCRALEHESSITGG